MSQNKVIVIGLDGAPFQIIRKWAEEGFLPNLAQAINRGCFGSLLSSELPSSPVAWSSITTGKNPGKHGVFDWAERKKGSYEIGIVNSHSIKQPVLWDILGKLGKRVGIYNIPLTYPPKEVNGFLVSGFDTPNSKVCFSHPQGLIKEIKNKVGDYPLSFREAYIPGKEEEFTADLKYNIDKKKETIFYLMENFKDLDFYFFVFMELDHLHHKLWRLINDKKGRSYLLEVYQAMDNAVGEIIKKFDKNSTFFIISDHGAGPLEGIMYINSWLENLGLLKLKKTPILYFKNLLEKTNLFSKIYCLLSKLGLGRIVRSIPKSLQEGIARSFFSFKDIDWMRTKAYSFGEYGQIYLNLAGREPQGIVKKEESEALLNYLIQELLTLKERGSGKNIISRIYKKEELYHGSYLENAPDLIFHIGDFRYDSAVSFGFANKRIFDKPEFQDSGTHRSEGIFIAYGQGINNHQIINDASLLDIAPTLLYLLKLPIFKDMDGRVLREIFKKDFLETNKIKTLESQEILQLEKTTKRKAEISNQEMAEVKKRLKSLGYLQ